MRNWKRITLVIFVLVGGTTFFGYWSIKQFNNVFDDLSASLASTYSSYPSFFKQRAELASTFTEIYGGLATSTNSELTSTSTVPELSFIFPQNNTRVYIGCTYQISWQSSTTINSLQTALVDAGTMESVGPIASGLAKENTIGRDLQNLEWKVGVVWPGTYYIKVSKIHGVEVEFRSKVFEINKMPKGIDEEEKINLCRESSS